MSARISSLTNDVFQLLRHGSGAKQASQDKRLEALVANSSDIVAILLNKPISRNELAHSIRTALHSMPSHD